MVTEQTLEYNLSYYVTYDPEIARQDLPGLWEDCDQDDSFFLETLQSMVLGSLRLLETAKSNGELPRWIRQFSVREEVV